jgi:hypothetical protein
MALDGRVAVARAGCVLLPGLAGCAPFRTGRVRPVTRPATRCSADTTRSCSPPRRTHNRTRSCRSPRPAGRPMRARAAPRGPFSCSPLPAPPAASAVPRERWRERPGDVGAGGAGGGAAPPQWSGSLVSSLIEDHFRHALPVKTRVVPEGFAITRRFPGRMTEGGGRPAGTSRCEQ